MNNSFLYNIITYIFLFLVRYKLGVKELISGKHKLSDISEGQTTKHLQKENFPHFYL